MRTLDRLRGSISKRGIGGTASHLYWHLRSEWVRRQELRFDRRYGTDTSGVLEPWQLGGPVDKVCHSTGYEAVTQAVFARMLRSIPYRWRDFTFVDLGSGKGRALMLAALHPFKRIIGVELAPELHQVALWNVSRFNARRGVVAPIELHCGSADAFELPDEETAIFLYNPFDAPVLQRVADRIEASVQRLPRRLVVLYRNPRCAFVLESRRSFRRVSTARAFRTYVVEPGEEASTSPTDLMAG